MGMIPSLGLDVQAGQHATGTEDDHVRTAAAEIPAHRPPDVLFRGRYRFMEKRPQTHDLTRRAEAALESVRLNKSLLHGIQLPVAGQPFGAGDLPPLAIDSEQQTGVHGPAIHEDCAGTAVAHVADFLRAGQMEIAAQGVEERAPRLQNELVFGTIEV
jgi:hypothetical protein